MAAYPCPHCRGPGISAARKLVLPAWPATCRNCGQQISISPKHGLLMLIPILVAVIVGEYAFPANQLARLLVLLAAGMAASVVQLRYVPLVHE